MQGQGISTINDTSHGSLVRRLLPSGKREGVILASRIVLGLLFLLSGFDKIQRPYTFLYSIYDYGILGPKAGLLTAITLPMIEILTGLFLIGGLLLSGSFLVSTLLLGLFTLVQSLAALRGLNIDCGCFSSSHLIGCLSIARNVLLLLAALAGWACVLGRYPCAFRWRSR